MDRKLNSKPIQFCATAHSFWCSRPFNFAHSILCNRPFIFVQLPIQFCATAHSILCTAHSILCNHPFNFVQPPIQFCVTGELASSPGAFFRFLIVWAEKRAWYTLCAACAKNITFMGGAISQKHSVSSLFLTVFSSLWR
jgi:hypothetical protein